MVGAGPAQDAKQHRRHGVQCTENGPCNAECPREADKQGETDNDDRQRRPYEVAPETVPPPRFVSEPVVEILLQKKVDHDEQNHTADTGGETVEDITHDRFKLIKMPFESSSETHLHIGVIR